MQVATIAVAQDNISDTALVRDIKQSTIQDLKKRYTSAVETNINPLTPGVVEGNTPLPLGSTCRRKRLRSAGEEDDEEARRSCASRPNPEGSLSASELSCYGKPEEEGEELQRLCQRCHIMASQLKRQAAALADSSALKVSSNTTLSQLSHTGRPSYTLIAWKEERGGTDQLRGLPDLGSAAESGQVVQSGLGQVVWFSLVWSSLGQVVWSGLVQSSPDLAYASFLFDKLQRLQWPRRSRHATVDARCDVCAASFQQLRRLALRQALGISREMTPHPDTPSAPPTPNTCNPPASESSWVGDELPVKQQRWLYEGQRQGGGALWGWGGVQSTYLGGGGAKGLATVTPLPLDAHHYLEGVWSVSCCSPEHQHTTRQEAQSSTRRLGPGFHGPPGTPGQILVHRLDVSPSTNVTWIQTQTRDESQDQSQDQGPMSTLLSTVASDGSCATVKNSTQVVAVKPAAHSIATQTSQLPSAAAAFFIRAAQKLSLSRKKKSQPGPASSPSEAPGPLLYTGGFSGALQLSPPAVPPCLLRAGSKVKDTPGMGKVRVMVRICSVYSSESSESMSFLKVDGRKKQLSLCETSGGGQRRSLASAPKTFTFDAVFSLDSSQAEVCSGTVAEVIQSVVNGADGCIFCFGHANLGKTYTMIGRDCSTQSLGVAPTAISWLFKVIEERREKAGARLSVRVSAVEISGREETLTDLLARLSSSPSSSSSSGGQQEAPGPAVSLREDPVCGSQLQNQTELRANNAERAAFFLDAALAERRSSRAPSDQEARRNSHFLFTLHLYQERLDKSSKAAMSGRSRLHLLDLGSCETDISRTREGGGGQCLSLSALGNVILALANGAKHVPYRDSKLTMLLSESLGNINCRTTMIAHISDSPANYMETLTTVQLASRIHHMRKKKSKYASSSSGGESSCEEGPSHRPPHLRSFHPRTVALDPDTPLLLSSDPDYSSSSEHSCDTVIYIGPGGTAILDRDLSDNEGPPSFVPIIPSLNKKRVKDTPRSDGDHFKCNTFAELQERLDCIDGSEGPATFGTEGKAAQAAALRTGATKPTEVTSQPKSDKNSSQRVLESTPTACTNKPDQEQEPVVREKVYLKGGGPKPSASPSLPRTSRAASQPGEVVARTPPVGMSQQALRQGQPLGPRSMGRALHTSRGPMELNNLRASLLGRCLDRDFLRTTVTLQQPVELNGEDELVFTVVEELPHGLVPDNGHPSNLLSFNSDCSLEAFASGSRPVSIISSINDEYDAYTSQQGAMGPGDDVGTYFQEMFSRRGSEQSSIGSRPSEETADSAEREDARSTSRLQLRDKNMATENASTLTSPSIFHTQQFLQHGIKSSLNDSGVCFSELDSNPATPNKPSFTKCPPSPDSTKASLKGSLKVRANTLNSSLSTQIPHHASHSSLPRKTKPTSSAGVGCSKQEGRHDDFLLQGSSHLDPREVEFLSAGKPSRSGVSSASSKRSRGNSNSVPRPPKAQVSSSGQRVVDGCEKSSSRRGDTLIKLPRLTRGATTLGTVSIPQSSESKWGHETTSVAGTLRFASLGKKSNGQRTNTISKSGSGNISPSALKTSSDIGKSSFPKTSTSVEEFTARLRADSFSHRTSSLKTEHGSARTSSSLKARKADSSKYYGSLLSLERCDSQAFAGSKSELFRDSSAAAVGGNSRSNRSVSRLGVPASTSTSASSSQVSPGIFATTSKLGQVRVSGSSRAAVSGGLKVRTLSTSSSKSLSSSPKPPDNAAGRNPSLPLTSKSPARSGIGAKTGRGTIMGTKQAISRAANSRVSELAAGSPRKQLSRGHGLTGSDATDSGTSSVSGSPVNTPIPSPYSKITAPRRPQRYSSGHGSDNSSILSGELPPAMGRTALFYHSGGSSGYESMIRDSETTGSTSSAHDSMSESGVSSSSRSRVSKSPKKRGNGFLRRRLIPAPLPDPSSLSRKVGGQWVDVPPLGGTLKEPFEIKVYEIDDVERLQRGREVVTGSEGLLYFNARLRMLERRQQQIRELRSKHERLKVELEEAKSRLMLRPDRWSGEFDVDQGLDRESQEYLEALAQATADLEYCVNLCKSHVMMETCFDIAVTTAAAVQGGQQEVEV
ncbi:kinesin-like protein KIF26A [Seriola dumerili]|uniref:kinesin-like protein KIF26A n=1 Tax=Seriola dumerili TaxID=41447 RepID=UPI000BBF0397|nr:kinesin-like protein KIF26A [Seriola dumerili]